MTAALPELSRGHFDPLFPDLAQKDKFYLASLGGAKAIIKTADVSMNIEESGDNILVKVVNEDSSVELGGVFSRQKDELMECGARMRLGNGEWVKVLSAKIKYNQPITVEQICAAPNK